MPVRASLPTRAIDPTRLLGASGRELPLISLPATPRRILLVRLSAIGDILFATPLVRALRGRFPGAHISWLVQSEYLGLLEAHPALDGVIPVPLTQWRRLWRGRQFRELGRRVRALRADLRRQGFDLAIDLQGLMKSGLLTWLSGAPARLGLGSREGSQWLMTQRLPRGGHPELIGSEYRYLAEQLGLPFEGFAMEVGLGETDEISARGLLAQRGLGNGYAALCPFTTRPQKHWFDQRWRVLAQRLQGDLGLTSILLGGPGDRDRVAGLVEEGESAPLDLVGRTSLREAAALIKGAALVVGVDTGLSHMGIAFSRPSVLLFGATCPYRETGRANARVLYHRLPCSPCRRRPTCGGAFTCMGAIGVEEVLETARAVLAA